MPRPAVGAEQARGRLGTKLALRGEMEPTLEVNPASAESLDTYAEVPVKRAEHRESGLTRLLEQQAAKVPSDYFLATALGAMAASLLLEFTRRPRLGRFIGLWPTPLLVMGVYTKLVKVFGTR